VAASKLTGLSGRNPNILTHQQERLTLAFARIGKRREAMIEAGYSTGTGWRQHATKLFGTPKIKARIAEHVQAIANKATTSVLVDRDKILGELWNTVGLATDKGDLASRIRALELLGKTRAMFTDKLISEDLDSSLSGKSPAEIEATIKALILEIGPMTVQRYLADVQPQETDESTRSGEDAAGAEAQEAGALPAVPEAGGIPPGGLLQ